MIRTAVVATAVASLTGSGSGKPKVPDAAALQALSKAVSAVDVSQCLRMHPELLEGPGGSGHIRVTFAPDGTVREARVDAWFAGTRLGHCIEGLFANLHLAPPVPAATVNRPFVVTTRWKPPRPMGLPFDARAADAAIRAVSLAPCSEARGPSEPMEADVYFEPTGEVGLVAIDGAFEGTATAACVANALRRASVPAFGSPVAKVRVILELVEN